MSNSKIGGILSDLHLLTVLAQTRSLTQAARRLEISKASVSMRLRQLEQTVGMSLVRRTTRAVTLTPAAAQLVQDTQLPFEQIERSFAQVKDLVGVPRGLVRITAPVALGRQRIAPTIATFVQRFPEIRLELDLSDRFANLTQEGFDLAVRHARSIPEAYVARVLCESRSWLLASKSYLTQRGIPQHPNELVRHDCLLYLRAGAAQTWSFDPVAPRKRAERVRVTVSGPFKANNSEVLREALLGGLGIGLLPDFSAAEAVHEGKLLPVLPAWRPVGFFGERVYAVWPGAVRASRAVGCVVEHLRQIFSTTPAQ